MTLNKLGFLLTLALLPFAFGDSESPTVAAPPLAVTAPDVADAPSGEAPPPPVELPPYGTEEYSEPYVEFDPQHYVHKLTVNGNGRGSCVSLGGGRYVTAAHMFAGHKSFTLRINQTPITVDGAVRLSPSADFAIFDCDLDLPGVPYSTELPAEGTDAICCGYGSIFTPRSCVVGEYFDDEFLSQLVIQPHGIRGGDSGGGVFVDGQLVGVLHGYEGDDETRSLFCPLHNVAALLAPFSPDAEANTPAPGAEDNRPVWTVYTIPGCAPCHQMHGYDFTNCKVRVEFKEVERHGVAGVPDLYPVSVWQVGGMTRYRVGALSPDQVDWLWEATK